MAGQKGMRFLISSSTRRSNPQEKLMNNIFVAGLSYKTAPVEVREQVAVSPSKLWCAGCRLKIRAGLSEVVLLSTCNRVEIYGVAPKINGNIRGILGELTSNRLDLEPHTYFHQGT